MKLILGDCLEKLEEIPDNSIDLICTDPPYGIDYQSKWMKKHKRFDKISGDMGANTAFIPQIYQKTTESGALYLFTRWDIYSKWKESIEYAGYNVKNCIIWDRIIHGMGDLKGAYAPCYDNIIFATKGRHILYGKRPNDVIRVKRVEPSKLRHPNQKPVELIKKLILSSTKEGDTVLDPFMGSGTTGVACAQLNRNFIGIELSEEYFEIAKKRIENESKQSKL